MKKVMVKDVKKALKEKIKEAELNNNLLNIVREIFKKYHDLPINKRLEKKIVEDFPNIRFRISEEYGYMFLNFKLENTEIKIKVGTLKTTYSEKKVSWDIGQRDIDIYDNTDYIAKYKMELLEVTKAVKKYNKAIELLQNIQDINCQIDDSDMVVKNRTKYSNSSVFKSQFPLMKEFGYL